MTTSFIPVAAPSGPVLRDIHLPPEPSWWPPAPGWWALGLIVLLALLALAWLGRRYQLRRHRQRQLMTALDKLASVYARDADPAALAGGVHQLLRRVARSHDPATTQESGLAWRQTLARVSVDSATLDYLLALDDAMYRAQSDFDVTATMTAARRWLQRASGSRTWKPLTEDARRA